MHSLISIDNLSKIYSNNFKALNSINLEIKKGEIFTTENITCKRPGTGISPMKFYNVIGLRSKKSFKYDDIIDI